MAPKKNVNKSPTLEKKIQEKKTPKPRMKKEKPKLRIPTVIKIKIPTTTLNKTIKKEPKNDTPKKKALTKISTPKFSKKQLDTLPELELANEVAGAQLLNIPVDLLHKVRTPPMTTEKKSETGNKKIRRKKTPKIEKTSATETTVCLTDSKVTSALLLTQPVDNLATPPTMAVKKSETGKKKVRSKKTPQIKKTSTRDTNATSCLTDSEVASAQLLTRSAEKLDTSPATAMKKPETGKKKVRSKKTPQIDKISATDTTVLGFTDSEDAFDMTPKKRKYIRRAPNSQAKKKPVVIGKSKVTVKTTNEPPKKKMKQTKITDPNTGIVSSPKTNTKYSIKPVKKKPITETKPRTRRPLIRKGKPDADTTSTSDPQKSPSLLERLENKSPKIENVVPNESPVKENLEACTIDSRKTSITGCSECPSWTKDISNSSTVTSVTVCSNDFVRIDKKIPILKLTNIDHQVKVETSNNSKSSSSSDSSSSSTSSSNSSESTPYIDAPSLDLSTTSVTPTKSRNSYKNNEENSDINYITALDRLTAKLKTFDLEIVNWIGYDETDLNVDIKKFQDNVFKILKEESQVITHCQRLKQVLSDNNQEDNNQDDLNNREQTAEKPGNDNVIIPENTSRNTILEEDVRNDDSVENNNNFNCGLNSPSKEVNDNPDENGNNFTSEKYKYTNFQHNYDDDDALSLFAESITGIESSRLNSSTTSVISNNSINQNFEEYIPQPLSRERWDLANKINYVPSKIINTDVHSQDNKKSICEKHRADSTSITKDVELDKNEIPFNIENNLNTTETNTNVFSQQDQSAIVQKKKMPCLMSSLFKSLQGVKSIVFRGMCFFYLISSCKNVRCRFPHVKPDLNEITNKLVRLSEEVFIQEYMLLRNWPDLRRKYGMCFVEECKRRELTRILVEMSIDFYMKAKENYIEDCHLKVIVMECTLLYLNTVNLATCEDLLLFNVQQGLLCDVFMKTIADTQNFSRFKQVFVKLTKFIVDKNKTFNLDVATQILERVCILPYEQSLSEALIEMINHTDRAIFDNSMIGKFENQLSSTNKDLYEKFLEGKEANLERPISKNVEISPCVNPDVEPVINASLVHTDREKRYTSPDTTNLDNMNKSTDETVFTRTIDFNRIRNIGVNIQRSFSNSNSPMSNDSTEELRPHTASMPTPNFQSWKGQSVYHKFRKYPAAPPQGSYMRPPLIKRRIHQLPNFGPSPSVCIP